MPIRLFKRAFRFVAMACLLFMLSWGLAIWYFSSRGPTLIKEVEFYDVDGLTTNVLKEQIHPVELSGHSALTYMNVTWNALCQVELHATITLPRHTRLQELGELQQQSWKTYLAALRRHEYTHQYHGERAAKEVAANYCIGGQYITGYWWAQTEIFDHKTRHGAKDGVRLDLWAN